MRIRTFTMRKPFLTLTKSFVVLLLFLIPLAFKNQPYIVYLAVSFCIYCALATNLNLLVGYAGQISFAHAAFFGLGAYVSAILATKLGVDFWFALPAAILIVGTIAFAVGVPTLRLRGSYLVICTMGLQLIIETLLLKWIPLTRGAMGIRNIPSPHVFGLLFDTPARYYLLAFAWLLLNILVLKRIKESRIGYELLAIREDEEAARSTGVDSGFLKIWAFSLSAGLAGGTGSLYAHFIHSIDPYPFSLDLSGMLLVMVILGGRGTVLGGAVGALILVMLPEWLRALYNFRMIFYGLAMILLIMYMPGGLSGWFERYHHTFSRLMNKERRDGAS